MKIVLLGKSGVGKTTQERLLSNRLGIPRVVSTTTRTPRPGEVDGEDYHFVSKVEFEAMQRKGKLMQVTEFKGNYYGAQRDHVPETCLFVVEPNGLLSLRQVCFDVIVIKMVLSDERRQQRLDGRGVAWTDEDEARFDACEADYVVNVGGDVESVTAQMINIIEKLIGGTEK